MNSFRLLLLVAMGCGLLSAGPLVAQSSVPPMAMAKQFSSDQIITTQDGKTLANKVFVDDGKVRTEMNMQGMQIVAIIRPDQKKMYQILSAQKMIMEMPYDAEKFKQQMAVATGADGKYDLIGPDPVDGVACTKYKMTGADNKVSFVWVDDAKKVPAKIAAEDGSYTIVFKNYTPGPQDAALFEPPAGYQVMTMPSMPGMPSAQ